MNAALTNEAPATIFGARQFDLTSPASGAAYRIQVLIPPLPAPPTGYPVAYFTDGAVNFAPAATQMWLRAGSELRPAVIVGVGYADEAREAHDRKRVFDLTPPTPKELSIFGDTPTGGSAEFGAFLVDVLRPCIAEKWPTDARDQTLFGHSLGGLFTLSVLARRPGHFSRYIASSPSIWWNDCWVLDELETLLAHDLNAARRAKIMLCVGDKEETAATAFPGATPDSIALLQRRLTEIAMIGRAEALSTRLEGAGLDVRYTLFAQEGHASVIPAAITRALDFAFSYEEQRPDH